MKKNIFYILFSIVLSGPISFKAFDYNLNDNFYGRGDYVIVLASSQLETYLTNPNTSLGGDFVKFKNTQGFNVHVVSLDEEGFSSAEELKNYLIDYDEQSNGMLEYVLLVGDVNGQYEIPTFTINSYNEQEIDVTDYPYTFTENPYEPKFFIGRWPIRTIPEFLNIKSRSIQYITNENLLLSNDSLDFYDNAMLVAGNYKTADGLEVSPGEWPVTPVWTSLWLHEELNDFGYSQIDTAFFHQYNYQTATYNPLIEDKWNEGVGVINYRGWGDANGWHKPYFHREEILSLDNQWRLPVVMSFVCNTGDFGNDYSGTG
ncbi:C25 family cysteine peptidase, partial [Candidatus Marinimicrobia bacterium]|nr:C25 family cysteine peptidase [Candidatus Neomarinimicrobiota bacterium]